MGKMLSYHEVNGCHNCANMIGEHDEYFCNQQKDAPWRPNNLQIGLRKYEDAMDKWIQWQIDHAVAPWGICDFYVSGSEKDAPEGTRE